MDMRGLITSGLHNQAFKDGLVHISTTLIREANYQPLTSPDFDIVSIEQSFRVLNSGLVVGTRENFGIKDAVVFVNVIRAIVGHAFCYFGLCNWPFSQPIVITDFMGSPSLTSFVRTRGHSGHWNVRMS